MGQTECRGCSTSDPATDTVKVSIGATLLADADAGKASSKHQAADVQPGPVLCQEDEESACREAEELSLREEEQERQRQREEERHRLAEEQQRWQRERTEAQAREEEEERHRVGSKAELAQRQAAEAAARRAEEEAKKKVEVFLKARGFKTMVMPRTTCFKATYPLHVAVQENSADVVSAFLLCGTDKKVKNSSDKTPLEVAQKLNNKGSHQAVIAALA
mmetsp:Transcript_6313/g.23710  ORF Transcript_6313/g.23710 Transcript_6313/m.23710 type:complete len:219 (-) Transcript_6313:596-1252(-)